MILTCTANPTIDRVLFVRDFEMQDVVRAEREVVSPSGKGIDVSLILHEMGAKTLAISLNAGHSGAMLGALLAERNLPHHFIPAAGQTRVAALITDLARGRQSTILAPTLTAGPQHLQMMMEQVRAYAGTSWGLVCAGSLPPGLPTDSWAKLLQLGDKQGLVTLLDSSGMGLERGIEGRPHILKINVNELAGLAATQGEQLPDWSAPDDFGDLIDWLQQHLGEWAQSALVITLGALGALAVVRKESQDDGETGVLPCEAIYVPALDVPFASAAGAGDAVAAGIIYALRHGQSWQDALRLGVAAAAAVVMNEGTAVCTAQQINQQLSRVQVYRMIQKQTPNQTIWRREK